MTLTLTSLLKQINNVNVMLIYVDNIEKKLIYVNYMLIYVNITDRRPDKHIKSINRNLKLLKLKY